MIEVFEWTPRTFLRILLVIGGSAFIFWGSASDEGLHMALGAIALVLGVFGLWYEATRGTA